jgi:hypothetical protein
MSHTHLRMNIIAHINHKMKQERIKQESEDFKIEANISLCVNSGNNL